MSDRQGMEPGASPMIVMMTMASETGGDACAVTLAWLPGALRKEAGEPERSEEVLREFRRSCGAPRGVESLEWELGEATAELSAFEPFAALFGRPERAWCFGGLGEGGASVAQATPVGEPLKIGAEQARSALGVRAQKRLSGFSLRVEEKIFESIDRDPGRAEAHARQELLALAEARSLEQELAEKPRALARRGAMSDAIHD